MASLWGAVQDDEEQMGQEGHHRKSLCREKVQPECCIMIIMPHM